MRRLCIFLLAMTCWPQEPEEGARQLWNTEFLNKRPAGTLVQKTAAYRPSTPRPTNLSAGQNGLMVGVTLWRVRDAKPADPAGSRILVLENESSSRQGAAERLSADAELSFGDRVRISIEVAQAGYLYVIDREQYSDNRLSDPYLIFPNRLTRPGDNAVAAGRLIDIPDLRDRPNVFTIRPLRADQVAEVLSILVSPQPLSEIVIPPGSTAVKIDPARYSDWEKKWLVRSDRFDLTEGAWALLTEREQSAAANSSAHLTQDDPLPMYLYRVPHSPNSPVIIQVPLRMKRAAQ